MLFQLPAPCWCAELQLHSRGLLNFLLRMRADEECYGAFYMHLGGEIDIRGTYCGLSAARLLNVITPELTKGCDDFLLRLMQVVGVRVVGVRVVGVRVVGVRGVGR